MPNLNADRRNVLSTLAGVTLAAGVPALYAQTKAIAKDGVNPLASRLRMVIPGGEGGGWDQTGRAVGAALVASGACEQVDYENIGGKGGTIGLASFVQRYSQDPNALMVGGTVMIGAVALQRPAVTLAQVKPLVRLTGDYLVLVVKADSPVRSTSDLVALVKANIKQVPFTGGSVGGIEHIFSALFARAAGAPVADLVYLPFTSGVQNVEAVLSGKAVAAISGYGELSEQLGNGKLRAIGVSARRPMFGIPAIRDEKVDVVMSNWRGLFVGSGVEPVRLAQMLASVKAATIQPSWQKTLQRNRWEPSWLDGTDLRDFMELDQTTAAAVIYMLKLKA